MNGELLLVVDVQNGFISERTRFVVPRIISLISSKKFENVAFTQFTNSDASPYERILNWFRLKSEEEQLIAEELRDTTQLVFIKTGYTVVNDEFKRYVSDKKIHTIYVAGIDTDCCVLASAISIFEMGIRPIVLAHYCASNGGVESHQAALRVLDRVIGPDQIVSGPVGE
jgi:nicotinamidase-related amidase